MFRVVFESISVSNCAFAHRLGLMACGAVAQDQPKDEPTSDAQATEQVRHRETGCHAGQPAMPLIL